MSEETIRYNRGARALHWAIALLVIANLLTGFVHDAVEAMVNVMPFHKASGLTILLLSLARLLWRTQWTRPPHPDTLGRGEILLAKAVQALFYGLMIAVPMSGWIITSAGKYPLTWFGLFDWPKLAVSKGSAAYGAGHEVHGIGGWIFLALVVLHVAAALCHHFILRDGVLRRMA